MPVQKNIFAQKAFQKKEAKHKYLQKQPDMLYTWICLRNPQKIKHNP